MKKKRLGIFFDNLSFLLGSGMNIIDAVGLLLHDTKDKKGKLALTALKRDLEKGYDLDVAFAMHEKLFGSGYAVYIASGLKNGNLPAILKKLSETIYSFSKIQTQLGQAMVYPALLFCMVMAATLYMFTAVIPQTTTELYAIAGGEPPAITATLMGISTFLIENGLVTAVLSACFLVLCRWFLHLNRKSVDRVTLHIPVLGAVIRSLDLVQLFSNLSSLIEAGIPLQECLDLCHSGLQNHALKDKFRKTILAACQKGESFGNTAISTDFFTAIDGQCIHIAQLSGGLVEMLSQLAQRKEEEATDKIKLLTSLLEPMIMIILGLIIGSIAFGVYMPIFSATNF